MSALLRGLRAFLMFWIDFIVGDDWTVAVAIVVALAATWGLIHVNVPAWWLLPLTALAMTLISVRRSAVHERRRNRSAE